MKTLGAETTAICIDGAAPSSNCLAKMVAVSSLYLKNQISATQTIDKVWTYPELAGIPIFREYFHGQGYFRVLMYLGFQIVELLLSLISLMIKIL